MRVLVVGAGYVGVVSGACLAEHGHSVTCMDQDPEKISSLQKGKSPFFEPNLDPLLQKNQAEGRLSFMTSLVQAAREAELILLAVGTPPHPEEGRADLSFLFQAITALTPLLSSGCVVVLKSTVPVGTGDRVEAQIAKARPGLSFSVASNPEFLREGSAIADFNEAERLVIGVADERAQQMLEALYAPLCAQGIPLLVMGRRSAELTKYASNAFLATKITFINEIADLCEQTGADVREVAKGMGYDSRIGAQFLRAGPGYGGSCFPKDTRALSQQAQEVGTPLKIVETVVSVNEERKKAMARRIIRRLCGKEGGRLEGRVLGILGLAFKPDTDDMREAPALTLLPLLHQAGARLRVFDPKSMREAAKALEAIPPTELIFCQDAYATAQNADALIVLTEWAEFWHLDYARLRQAMRGEILIDLRNLYDKTEVEAHGFRYHGIGF